MPVRTTARTRTGPGASAPERAAAYAVTALEGLVALSAVGGGGTMVLDPDGAMGLDPAMLDRLPVRRWRLPGLALIASNGLLPTATAWAEMQGRPWPRHGGHVLVGAVLLCWPVGETVLFGYPLEGEPAWLRPAVAGTGLAIIGLGLFLRTYPRA